MIPDPTALRQGALVPDSPDRLGPVWGHGRRGVVPLVHVAKAEVTRIGVQLVVVPGVAGPLNRDATPASPSPTVRRSMPSHPSPEIAARYARHGAFGGFAPADRATPRERQTQR